MLQPAAASTTPLHILEIGSGNGSSTVPLLRENANAHVHATDPSATAVALTRQACEHAGVADRLTTEIQSPDGRLGGDHELHGKFDIAMLIFTLSAVPRPDDERLLQDVVDAMRPGGLLCFRDYGNLDLRMLRDLASSSGALQPKSVPAGKAPRGAPPPQVDPSSLSRRVAEREFVRPGGMFRRYYAKEDVASLATSFGLETVEPPRYCCVRLTNQRRGLVMDRVYMHAVLGRPEGRES